MLRLESQLQLSKSDLIRLRVKEWIKSGDDLIPDEVKDLLKRPIDPKFFKVFTRRIVERYKEGTLSLHFHFRDTLIKNAEFLREVERDADVPEYCAIAQFAVSEHHSDDVMIPIRTKETRAICDNSDHIQFPVFIDVMECVEESQRVIPTLVRLQPFDQCRSFFVNTIEASASKRVFEAVIGDRDWELIRASRFALVGDSELPHEMIESRSDIEQEIACDSTEFGRHFGGDIDAQDRYLLIKVFLGQDYALAFSITGGNRESLLKMFICPVDLVANSY